MSTAPPPVLTPDDLLRMPNEGEGFELIGGRLAERPRDPLASRLAWHLKALILGSVDDPRPVWVTDYFPFRCFANQPDTVRRPTLSVVLESRCTLPGDEDCCPCPLVPDLVAEITTPTQKAYDLHGRIVEWLAAGVKLLWEVLPKTRSVRAYRPDGTIAPFRLADTLTAPDILPGFSCPVADLFRLPGEPVPAV